MIAANSILREELAACADLGIPHSQFLGGDGVWRALDRSKALGYRRYVGSLCRNCSTSPAQWARDGDAFTWQIERCEGCKRVADGQEAIGESKTAGLYVTLVPPRYARDD